MKHRNTGSPILKDVKNGTKNGETIQSIFIPFIV